MNILLVEDDAFFQTFYAGKLSEEHFTVTVAVNGEEGLRRAQEQKFNLIILDLIMPKVDGFSFLSVRQKTPQLSAVPVIVFSTLGQDIDVAKAKELGATDYVNKSFLDFPVLLAKIHEHILK
jgi:DNA-binding response OmpR family regulator